MKWLCTALLMLTGTPCVSSCASAPPEMASNTLPKAPVKGSVAEFSVISFDGRTLEGRLLLGATLEAFRLDARLSEDVDIELRNVRECGTNKMLEYYIFDLVTQPPRPDQIITVRPHYWYGINAKFLLFGNQIKEPKPQCFEAELWVWSLDGQIVVKHPIKAERTTQKSPETPASASPAVHGPTHRFTSGSLRPRLKQ